VSKIGWIKGLSFALSYLQGIDKFFFGLLYDGEQACGAGGIRRKNSSDQEEESVALTGRRAACPFPNILFVTGKKLSRHVYG